MAMNLGPQDDEDIIGTINTTPLVDVMLVLLIIFLITIPVVTTSVKVSLPQENNVPRETQPDNLIVSVDAAGRIFLYDTPLANSQALFERLRPLATRKPQPEVQIRGDGAAQFEAVGKVMNAVQRAGIAKVSFITEPSGPAATR